VIDLYAAGTSNGMRAKIMLDECDLAYTLHPIDLMKGDQKKPEFLARNPWGQIPVIVDNEGPGGQPVTLSQSVGIMIYLAEKTGKFWPTDQKGRWNTMQWLMWQMGGVGPMLGQVHHFVRFNKGKSAYAEERYLTEAKRLYGVLDARLADHEFVVDDYSVADIAIWPWISRFEWQTIDLGDYPNVKRWYLAIAGRPAVQRGYHIPNKLQDIPMP